MEIPGEWEFRMTIDEISSMNQEAGPPEFDIVQADIQLTCAKCLRWLLDEVRITDSELIISGWALAYGRDPKEFRFLLNGRPFASAEWPLPSPYLLEHFCYIPGAANARFICSQAFGSLDEVFVNGFACFSFTTPQGQHRRSYRHSWYYPDPRRSSLLPEDERIARIIGQPDRNSYLFGGATTALRYEAYLKERFGRSYGDFQRILDWGCGCGRLTRHLVGTPGPAIVGADIDADNIAWCRNNLTGGAFQVLPLRPPTLFAEEQFDLVIGTSVFTHLAKDVQLAWLGELRRITSRGAVLLMSVHGLSQLALYRAPTEYFVTIERQGLYEAEDNPQLDGMIGEANYYKNVYHSRDYIYSEWGRFFEVIDIVDALASNQDLVVLCRR
jgi:SAM-dependent methyltransferase